MYKLHSWITRQEMTDSIKIPQVKVCRPAMKTSIVIKTKERINNYSQITHI